MAIQAAWLFQTHAACDHALSRSPRTIIRVPDVAKIAVIVHEGLVVAKCGGLHASSVHLKD